MPPVHPCCPALAWPRSWWGASKCSSLGSALPSVHLIVTVLNEILLDFLRDQGPGGSRTVAISPKVLVPRRAPPRKTPTQQAALPLSAELGLSQNVGWQGVQRGLQQSMDEGLHGTKLSPCPPSPSLQEQKGFPCSPSPSCSLGSRSTAAQRCGCGGRPCKSKARPVCPALAPQHKAQGLGPRCTTTLCVAAKDQPWDGMGPGRDSPPTGPSPLAAALGHALPCRTAGCCERLSWWGGRLCLGEVRGLSPESRGTICKQR